jgi:hypothetical protein
MSPVPVDPTSLPPELGPAGLGLALLAWLGPHLGRMLARRRMVVAVRAAVSAALVAGARAFADALEPSARGRRR